MSPSASTTATVPLIELDQAHVIRGQVRVLHGLSLAIAQGQHTALLGPNGCGKSSFIKLITRELYPLARADGQPPVQVLGQSRWQVDRLRNQLGIVSGDLEHSLADQHGLNALDAVISGFFAWVVNADGNAEMRPLNVAGQISQQFQIASGVKPGERAITDGAQRVQPGAAVQILN